MRLRPDFAWAIPIPPINTLGDLLTPSHVIISNSKFYPGGVNDTFAFGVASAMDVYFDRLPNVHTFERKSCKLGWRPVVYEGKELGESWQAESFVACHLRAHGIELVEHNGFNTFPIREKAFLKGKTERTAEAIRSLIDSAGELIDLVGRYRPSDEVRSAANVVTAAAQAVKALV